jgi:hypothetical protein
MDVIVAIDTTSANGFHATLWTAFRGESVVAITSTDCAFGGVEVSEIDHQKRPNKRMQPTIWGGWQYAGLIRSGGRFSVCCAHSGYAPEVG